LEQKLAETLQVDLKNKYKPPDPTNATVSQLITKATHNQNLIGWNNFLKGYISRYWKNAQSITSQKSSCTKQSRWDTEITSLAITLLRKIWEARNTHVHGTTLNEANEKLRARIHAKVTQLYSTPPTLAPRYHKITTIPLEQRLRKPTKELQDWLTRIMHQQRITALINSSLPPGQLILQQAYARKCIKQQTQHKYPP
jgi:hypothetical protein